MTELVVLSHITPLGKPLDNDSYLGSCGKLLPGFEAMVINLILTIIDDLIKDIYAINL